MLAPMSGGLSEEVMGAETQIQTEEQWERNKGEGRAGQHGCSTVAASLASAAPGLGVGRTVPPAGLSAQRVLALPHLHEAEQLDFPQKLSLVGGEIRL